MEIADPVKFRENVCDRLNMVLDDKTIATNMEKGIYNYAIKEANSKKIIKKWDNPYFAILYIDRLRSIYFNIKNPELLQQIKNKDITPQTVAFMTHHELLPDKWSMLIEAKSKRDKNKFEVNISAATDVFTCRKCKGNQCTYYQMQTRSADEPMTTFVTCLLCSTRWKC
jgi:transcription elongation factor S-II